MTKISKKIMLEKLKQQEEIAKHTEISIKLKRRDKTILNELKII